MGRFCDGGVRYRTSFFQESLERCDAVRLCLYNDDFCGYRIRDVYSKDLSSESANQRLSLLKSPRERFQEIFTAFFLFFLDVSCGKILQI
jgi:hypothetical protein